MEHARTRGGVAAAPAAPANKYSQEELRLMKSQDAGYLTLKAQAEAKARPVWHPGGLLLLGLGGLRSCWGQRRPAPGRRCCRVSSLTTCPPPPSRSPQLPQKVERLQQSLHLIGAPPANRHTVFVEDAEEAAAFDPATHFDTAPELLGRAFNRPRLAQLADAAATNAGEGAAAAVARIEK